MKVSKKECTSCKRTLDIEKFYSNTFKPNYFTPRCKECINEYARKSRDKNKQITQASISFVKEEKKIQIGEFYIPDIILVGIGRQQTYQHVCLKCKSHFFCMIRSGKEDDVFCDCCQINDKFIKENNKSPIKYIGNVIGWKIIVEIGDIKRRTTRNYKKVYQRDFYTCQYCGYNLENTKEFLPLHIDHIKPISAGGNNSMENMCVSCQKCNLKASDKWFHDFQDKKEYILKALKYG